MRTRKTVKNWKFEDLDISDLPSSFLEPYTQIKREDRGGYKLRARNDRIHAELSDYAIIHRSNVKTAKSGGRIFYTLGHLGVTVSLEN